MEKKWQGLEELVAVASAGSFVGAARLLGVSTSHVSRAIIALEERVNTSLFFRTTRMVRPTDAGLELVDRARQLIEERDDAFNLIMGKGELFGQLRITCSVHLGERFVAPITHRFAKEHPNVSVRLDLTNRLVDLVGEGYDLGIRTGKIGDDRLNGTPIGERSFYLCAAPSYLVVNGSPRSVVDLENHDCLIGNAQIWRFKDGDNQMTYEPHGRWACSSSAAIVDACLAGMGICQLPALYVANHLREGRLVRLLAPHEENPQMVWAIYPRRFRSLARAEAMIKLLASELPQALSVNEMRCFEQPVGAAAQDDSVATGFE
ncbi:MAG: LysR family transcriptional regulator [Pseudomonadota bacterium]